MIRVGVHGAAGRMGRLLVAGVLASPELRLAAAFDAPGASTLGADAGRVAGSADAGVLLQPVSPAALADCDVVVDFSLPGGTLALLAMLDRPLVLGTTGLGTQGEAALSALALRQPVLAASNFSTGVTLMLRLVAQAAKALPSYDLEVVEMHHGRKRDAPSGTALSLARAAAQARGQVLEDHAVNGRSGDVGPRPPGEIGLHAVRGGDVVGEHTVYLAGPGERLLLGHLATSREAFAQGALRAAGWLVGKPPGRYGMDAVLGS